MHVCVCHEEHLQSKIVLTYLFVAFVSFPSAYVSSGATLRFLLKRRGKSIYLIWTWNDVQLTDRLHPRPAYWAQDWDNLRAIWSRHKRPPQSRLSPLPICAIPPAALGEMFFSLVYVWDGRHHPFTWRAPAEQDTSDAKQKRDFGTKGRKFRRGNGRSAAASSETELVRKTNNSVCKVWSQY